MNNPPAPNLPSEHHFQTSQPRELLACVEFAAEQAERVNGAVLGSEAFVIRLFGDAGDDRLLVVNLGRDLSGAPIAEPLLAPSIKGPWKMIWTSEDPRYGGLGVSNLHTTSPYFHGQSAVVLAPDVR